MTSFFPLEAVLNIKAKLDPFSKQGHQLEYATKQGNLHCFIWSKFGRIIVIKKKS
jgi:hypothetical protein